MPVRIPAFPEKVSGFIYLDAVAKDTFYGSNKLDATHAASFSGLLNPLLRLFITRRSNAAGPNFFDCRQAGIAQAQGV
jgi:hypothetical protein